jgi:hypothetical protein
LRKLRGELEAGLRRHIRHVRLHGTESATGPECLRLRHDSHAHVLLRSLYLLLLLLQELDLLLDGQLLDSRV